MLLGDLDADFQFGVLLITDRDSSETIPEWGSPDELVTASESAVVVRVRHADEGSVTVRVWDNDVGVDGAVVYDGRLRTTTRVVTVSDALGTATIMVDTNRETCQLRILINSSVEPDLVNVVLGNAHGK